MAERPIILRRHEVRALLNYEDKTQLRRLLVPQPPADAPRKIKPQYFDNEMCRIVFGFFDDYDTDYICPYRPGDTLWVKETFQVLWLSFIDPETGFADDWEAVAKIPDRVECNTAIAYAASHPLHEHPEDRGFVWRPATHMPRWASRLTLEVTDVRAERIQGMTIKDLAEEAIDLEDERAEEDFHFAESTQVCGFSLGAYKYPEIYAFAKQWERTEGKKKGYTWEDDPYVWVISFKVIPTEDKPESLRTSF